MAEERRRGRYWPDIEAALVSILLAGIVGVVAHAFHATATEAFLIAIAVAAVGIIAIEVYERRRTRGRRAASDTTSAAAPLTSVGLVATSGEPTIPQERFQSEGACR